jgi:hypothetical protein
MNFFDPEIASQVPSGTFYLCDRQAGDRAFVSTDPDEHDRVADVQNSLPSALYFVPVDKGVLQDDDPTWQGRGRCDALLHCLSHIVFVELKDRRSNWISDAVHQLGDTVELFNREHPDRLMTFAKRHAYACNNQRPTFAFRHKETMKTFRDRHHVILRIQASITIPW